MGELKKVQPKSREAWRGWLEKHHAASTGVWLVFAKKHTGLPTLSYEDAVQEALCFGWIDSILKSIDDCYHMQMFTPRKPKSAWSVSNKARLAKLMKAGLMAPVESRCSRWRAIHCCTSGRWIGCAKSWKRMPK